MGLRMGRPRSSTSSMIKGGASATANEAVELSLKDKSAVELKGEKADEDDVSFTGGSAVIIESRKNVEFIEL